MFSRNTFVGGFAQLKYARACVLESGSILIVFRAENCNDLRLLGNIKKNKR